MNARQSRLVSWLMIGAGAGAGIAWLARGYARKTSVWTAFEGVLVRDFGKEKGRYCAMSIAQHYAALLAQQPLPRNPALKRHLTGHILPGLALYQVLLKEYNGDRQTALAEIDQAFRAWTFAQNRLLLAPLKILPNPFWLFKLAFALRMQSFPADGWDFQFVENSGDRISFNATRCFYLNTLTAYGAPELTPSFCKMDDVMAELLPPSVRFVRPHTLGRGDAVCDFQYCRVIR